MDKTLTILRKRDKIQITKIRDERGVGNATINLIEIKRIIRAIL